MPSAFDKDTLGFYASSAESYLSGRPKTTSRHLDEFPAQLEPGASILELGCGAGRDAEAMIASGFQVDPTDGVQEIAQIASKRLGQDVRVMRFDELDGYQKYDAVWSNASLHHVPREELPSILRLIFKALKPGGLHFANYKGGESEGRDKHTRYYNYMRRSEMVDLYTNAAEWEVVAALDYVAGSGLENIDAHWVAITVRKRKT